MPHVTALLALSLAAGGATWTEADPPSIRIDPAPLRAVEEQVRSGSLVKLTGVLVARQGKLVFERYFGEANADTLLDTRSATKTLTGYLVGAAIDRKLLPSGVATRLGPVFKDRRPFANPDPRKERITVALRCQGWVPRNVNPGSSDDRTLGVSVYSVIMRSAKAGKKVFNANTGE